MSRERIYWSDSEYERLAAHLLKLGVSPLARGLSGYLIRAQRELFAEQRWRSATSLRAVATVARVREIMHALAAREVCVAGASVQADSGRVSHGDYLSVIAKRMGRVLAEMVMNSALDHIESEMPKRLRASVGRNLVRHDDDPLRAASVNGRG